MARTYDREFKLEALQMASEPGVTAKEVESRLGIGQGVLSHWKRKLREDDDKAFPGKGHLPPQEEELRRLKRECERLRREREILKKALAIFSKDPHRYSGS
jgi:transposase